MHNVNGCTGFTSFTNGIPNPRKCKIDRDYIDLTFKHDWEAGHFVSKMKNQFCDFASLLQFKNCVVIAVQDSRSEGRSVKEIVSILSSHFERNFTRLLPIS